MDTTASNDAFRITTYQVAPTWYLQFHVVCDNVCVSVIRPPILYLQLADRIYIIGSAGRDSSVNLISTPRTIRGFFFTINGYLVSKQITDIVYVLRKYAEKDRIRSFALFLCKAFTIIPFCKEDIESAADLNGKDFENDILIQIAETNSIDCIVTNNTKDFLAFSNQVFRPDELLKTLFR